MKYYKLTLLKDLPNLKAGFSITLSESQFDNPFGYGYIKPGLYYYNTKESREYTEQVYEICRYKSNAEWVKVEPDFSKGIKLRCPNCGQIGMFSYVLPELERVQETPVDDVYYYRHYGLECAECGFKICTHKILDHIAY